MTSIENKKVIGVDFGGTTIKAGVVTSKGEVLAESKVPTLADDGPQAVVGQIALAVSILLNQPAGKEATAIGIGAPGIVDNDGYVRGTPNVKNWESMQLGREIEKRCGLPTIVENDANVAGLAEAKFGAGVGIPNFLFVIWGTGVGGGIIIDGKLFRGPSGGAGEIGHMTIDVDGPQCNCGNYGCVEAFVGQRHLSRRTAEKLVDHPNSKILQYIDNDFSKLEPVFISKAAHEGDALAREVFIEAGSLLGVALAAAMNTLDLRVSIIGGGISAAGDFVMKAVEDSVRSRVLKPLKPEIRVLPAELGNCAGMLGAAGLVL